MIYLIRHAECQGNIDKVWKGVTESPLTLDGCLQVTHLSRFLSDKRLEVCYTSPILRAVETSLAITSRTRIVLDELAEVDGGKWEDMYFEDILSQYQEEYYKFFNGDGDWHIPGGGSYAAKAESLQSAYKHIAYFGEISDVAVVSHGVTLRILASLLTGSKYSEAPWLDNCSITTLGHCKESGLYQYVKVNDTSFLPECLRGFTKNNWADDNKKVVGGE